MEYEIYHAAKKNSKYVAKVGKGKDARYFYTQAEYAAYLKQKHKTKSATQAGVAGVKVANQIQAGLYSARQSAIAIRKAKDQADAQSRASKRISMSGNKLINKSPVKKPDAGVPTAKKINVNMVDGRSLTNGGRNLKTYTKVKSKSINELMNGHRTLVSGKKHVFDGYRILSNSKKKKKK